MRKNLYFKKNIKVLFFLLFLLFLFILIKAIKLDGRFFNLTANVSNSVTVEDLGSPFQNGLLGGVAMYKDQDGGTHWFGSYTSTTGSTQFLDINTKTGDVNYFDTKKRGGAGAKSISGDKLYVGLNECTMWEYDLKKGKFTEVRSSSWKTGNCGTSGSDVGIYAGYTAPDGILYFSTTIRGTLFEIDPSNNKIRDFGLIDPPAGDPQCNTCKGYRYMSTLVADNNYVYGGMREAGTNSWWLVILNRNDGSVSDSCWKTDNLNAGRVSASTDGTQIWYYNNSGYYRLDNTNGKCPTNTSNPPSLKPWFYPDGVYNPDADNYSQSVSSFGVDIDASSMVPDSSNSGVVTFKYRNPAGSGSYASKTQAINITNSPIRRIKAKDNKNVYLGSGTYGPNALFDGSKISSLGTLGTSQSLYALTPLGQYVYLSGYTANTFRWSPNSSWDFTADTVTSCNNSNPSNPCLALQGLGKYHFYSTVASDGLLYLASDYDRGSRAGGDIAWINPANNSSGSVQLTCDSPTGFALLSDSKTIAYSGDAEGGSFGCTNNIGTLFLFDTTIHQIKSSLKPIDNADNQGNIVATKDGGILGVLKDFPASGKYTMYKIDQNGNHASWSPTTINGNIFGSSGKPDRHMALGSDGMIYTWDSAGVVQINPTDGSVSSYAKLSGITYLEFAGNDMYIAVGTQLKRIKDAVSNTPAPSANKSVQTFTLNALSPSVQGTIDDKKYTIDLTVPYGTNVQSLAPTITLDGKSISPASGVAQDFTKSVTYTVTAEDSSTQDYKVTVTVAPDSSKPSSSRDITSFDFKGLSPSVQGDINQSSRVISLTVPYGTNISNLVPAIKISGKTISPNSGVAQDFTKSVTYTVTAEDSTTQKYTVNVKVASKVLSSTKSIKSFDFKSLSPNVKGSIDTRNNIITLNVPYGTDVSKLKPTVSFDGSSISPSTSTAVDFTKSVTYTVTAEDSTTQKYTIKVVVDPKPVQKNTSTQSPGDDTTVKKPPVVPTVVPPVVQKPVTNTNNQPNNKPVVTKPVIRLNPNDKPVASGGGSGNGGVVASNDTPISEPSVGSSSGGGGGGSAVKTIVDQWIQSYNSSIESNPIQTESVIETPQPIQYYVNEFQALPPISIVILKSLFLALFQ